MRLITCLVVAGLAWAAIGRAEAQDTAAASASPSTIEGGQRYTLTSAKTQRRYLVDVLPIDSIAKPLPADYRRPVIYVLDGNSLFPLVAHIAIAIGLFSSQVPGVLVVTIGYPRDAALSYAENVKTQSDAHAFSRYVAISPSLFWDDHAMNTRAVEFAKRRDLASTRLFVAVGEQETKERMGEDMIGDARQFVSVLQAANPSGLDVQLQIFPDENHMTVVPAPLTRGLLQVKALR